MKKAILLAIILIFCISLAAEQKSIRKAMALSVVLPGAGEIYAHEYSKAAVFLSLEAAAIFTYLRLQNERQWAVKSYKQFAFGIADIPKDREDFYYQLLQDYISSDLYNESIIRDARNYFIIYNNDPVGYEEYLDKYLVPEEMSWDWENDRNWYKYRALRRNKQDMEIYMKFAFAAVVLNRLISMIDSAVSAKRYNQKNEAFGSLMIYPDLTRKEIKINYEYRF